MAEELFEGLDFANRQKMFGRCCVLDDGDTLKIVRQQPGRTSLVMTAVDCPFGISAGFDAALSGKPLDDRWRDGFKSRWTEVWIRKEIQNYASVRAWCERGAADCVNKETSYFNSGGHVQPAAGMKILPECLKWIADRLAPLGTPETRYEHLRRARMGTAAVCEAHPRMYLYSAIEQIWQRKPLSLPDLRRIRDYRKSEENRHFVLELLLQNPIWLGCKRAFHVDTDICRTDHTFDAWLCAMTAWSHRNGHTVSWREVGIHENIVAVEGHILILSQVSG